MTKYNYKLADTADKDEVDFLVKLNNSINLNTYEIKRTNHISKYYSVDYQIFKDDEIVLNLELKSRTDISYIASEYKSFMIGKRKLDTIREKFKKTILIWNCKKTGKFYFTRFKNEFNDLDIGYMGVSAVQYIPVEECSSGFDELIKDINDYSTSSNV